MRAKLILLALTTIIGGAAAHGAPVRVAFSGTLTDFEAGYEPVMGPNERVQGEYTIPAPEDRQSGVYFGVPIAWTRLSTFWLTGSSGWSVTANEGVVRQDHNFHSIGYRYTALAGEVDDYLDVVDGLGWDGFADDINRNDHFGPDGIDTEDPGEVPDRLPPTPVRTVSNPVAVFTIAGPSEWWNAYGDSPIPPPLLGATRASISMTIYVFLPSIGTFGRAATFEITSVHVVPEPIAAGMRVTALLGWLALSRGRSRLRSSAGC